MKKNATIFNFEYKLINTQTIVKKKYMVIDKEKGEKFLRVEYTSTDELQPVVFDVQWFGTYRLLEEPVAIDEWNELQHWYAKILEKIFQDSAKKIG